MNKFFKYWLPALVWAGFIFWLSSIPNLKSGLEQDFILRKIAHILEYAILTFLFLRGISAYSRPAVGWKKIVISSIVFSLFYALADEYHQTFVFGREGSLKDVGIDSVGIILTSILWYTKHIKLKGR